MKITKILISLFVLTISLYANNTLAPVFQKLASSVKAPNIILESSEDKVIKLSDYKGKIVVLNFWATWCPPCKKEMPSLQRFSKMTKDKNIVVLAVAVGQDEDDVFPFVNTLKTTPTFPILYDKTSITAKNWGITAMPTTIIINKDGYLTHFALGAREFDNNALIDAISKIK